MEKHLLVLGDGYIKDVRNKSDIKKAKKKNRIQVNAICPNCKQGFASIIANAEMIIKHGCLLCTDKWTPSYGIELDDGTIALAELKKGDTEAVLDMLKEDGYEIHKEPKNP